MEPVAGKRRQQSGQPCGPVGVGGKGESSTISNRSSLARSAWPRLGRSTIGGNVVLG